MSRTVVKVADDEYLEWSSVVDAPVTSILNRAQAIREFGLERVERTDRNGHSAMWCEPEPGPSFIRFNRAGPRECNLTPDAIRVRYREGYVEQPLHPSEIQITTTSHVGHPDIPSDWLFWSPWRPSEAPDEITDETDLHATVRMTPEEEAVWDAATWEERTAILNGERV